MADSYESLVAQVRELSPWHLRVQLCNGVDTSSGGRGGAHREDFGRVSFIDDEARFKRVLDALFPSGLDGRSFFDVACNCGAYGFWARDCGAGRVFGFDIREHWIRQAKFVMAHRDGDVSDMRFEILDVYDLPRLPRHRFGLSLVKSILYHLPRPLEGLKAVADLTDELIIVDTATRWLPSADGWMLGHEDTRSLMNGVYNVNWYPTGESSGRVPDIRGLHRA